MGSRVRSVGAFLLTISPSPVHSSRRSLSRCVMNTHLNKFALCKRSLWGFRAVLGTTLVSENSPLKRRGDLSNSVSCPPTGIDNASSIFAKQKTEVDINPSVYLGGKVNHFRDSSSCDWRNHYHDHRYALNLNPITAGVPLNLHVRNYSTRRSVFRTKQNASFYDILGITPHATQAQVKSAYYKLSKMHHPDTQQNQEPRLQQESQEKFGQINEAYGVLGNPSLRRRYDRGILSPRDTAESVKKQDAASARDQTVYRKATDKRLYDFDEFYQKHYGESIARERQARADQMAREAEFARLKAEHEKHVWYPRVFFTLLMGVGAYYVYKEKFEDLKSPAEKNRK